MLLRYVELQNFLGHENEQITLPASGIFLLSGESGSGKSSMIVDAVAYALYGPVATRVRRQQELRNHDHTDRPMRVRATFEFPDGRQLTLARGIDESGAGWAQATEPAADGTQQIVAKGADPVGRLVRKQLGGMSWQQFYAAFVARQKEITLLTEKRGAQRKELIQRMLGMRELEKAAELLSARYRKLNAERDQLERSVGEFDLIGEERELSEGRRQAAEQKQRITALEGELKAAEAEIDSLDAEIEPLQLQRQQAEQHQKAVAEAVALRERLGLLSERKTRSDEASKLAARRPELEQRVAELEAERERLRREFASGLEQDKLAEKIASLSEARSELRHKLGARALQPAGPGGSGTDAEMPSETDLRDEQGSLRSRVEMLSAQRDEQAAQLERLRESGECFACQRPFDTEHDHEQVISSLEQSLAALNTQIEEAEKRRSELESILPAVRELDSVEQKLSALRDRLDELGTERIDTESIAEQGKQVKARLEQASAELAAATAAAADYDETLAAQIEEVSARLAEIESLPSLESDFDPSHLAGLEQKRSSAQGTVERLRGQIPEARTALEQTSQRLELLEKSLEGRRLEIKRLEGLREGCLDVERLQEILKHYQGNLASEIRPALEEIGSEMLARVSRGKHVGMEISEDYEVSVRTSNGVLQPSQLLSGGEEIRANICLRLALTRLVSQRTGVPVSFLILDEPLPSQDDGHVERIMELLESLRPFYPQQFVISHVGELASNDQVDYVLSFASEPNRAGRRVELVAA